MSLLLSNFYPRADAVLISGNQQITGLKTFNERINVSEIRGLGFGGSLRRIDFNLGHLYSNTAVSLDYFQRILSGSWKFNNRPTVNGVGVLLEGEGGGGGTITLPSNILFTTGTQTITGPKNFTARPTFNNSNLITANDLNTQDSFDGNRPIKAIPVNNTNYGGTTISGFLENIFFPYLQGSLTLSSVTSGIINAPFTYGVTSPIAATFNGSFNQRDDQFSHFQFFRTGIGNSFTPLTNFLPGLTSPFASSITLGETVLQTSDNIYGVRASGTRNNQSIIVNSSLGRIRFEPRYYTGFSTLTTLTANDILNTLNFAGPNNQTSFYNSYSINGKPGSVQITYTNPIGQYLYFVYPGQTVANDYIVDWGNVSSIRDTNNIPYTTEFITLPSLVTINFPHKSLNYKVVRSVNTFNLPNESFTFIFNLT